ncbi:OmpH family outer membrane protein [Candidatus Pelagibacter sp.]|nr:OmpH family outer membrane protein [Candidatus Pelagibacter sp.]
MIVKLLRYSIIFFFLLINNLYAEKNIVYIDLELIMNKSTAGKSIIAQINKKQNILTKNFIKKEKILKEEEVKLISQKNVLIKEEFSKKIEELKKKIIQFNSDNVKSNNELNRIKTKARAILLSELSKIVSDYAQENSIDIVLPKKNIFLGKVELDVSNIVLNILDKKLKEVKID